MRMSPKRSLWILWGWLFTLSVWCFSPQIAAATEAPATWAYPLTIPEHVATYELLDVTVESTPYLNQAALQVELAPGAPGGDRNTMVWVPGLDFHNGVIELDLAVTLQEDAPPFAKGFAGVAFRAQPQGEAFEGFYLRPVNARLRDQRNRNHSTQYFSYPDYDFSRLREEAPGRYEAYADMVLNQWLPLKIAVEDAQASLYLNHADQPALIVTDLKQGAETTGTVGLWVDVGTRAYFSHLRVTPLD